MPLLLVRHLKAVPQTKIKKQKHSIPLHLEGTNVLPALCLLNYLFFFSSEQEDNILETNTPQHLQKYLPLAKSLSPSPPVPLFCCIRKATGGDLLPFKPSRNVCKRETVSFQHPQNSWWSLIMHTGQVSAASKKPSTSIIPTGDTGVESWHPFLPPGSLVSHDEQPQRPTHSQGFVATWARLPSNVSSSISCGAGVVGTVGSPHLQKEARCAQEPSCKSSTPSAHYPHLPQDAMSLPNPPSLPVSCSQPVAIIYINTIIKSSDSQNIKAPQIQCSPGPLSNFSRSSG